MIFALLTLLSTESAQQATFGSWGIETQAISKTILPGDDFFTYVNEGWLKSTKIPDGYWDYGQTTALGNETNRRIRQIIRSSARAEAREPEPRRRVGDLYQSFLNTSVIEARGLGPLRRDLASIMALKTYDGVARWMGDPRSSSLVAINVYPDAGNTKRYLVHLDQSNPGRPLFGLPRLEYYRRDGGAYPGDRTAYVAYISKFFQSAEIDRPHQRAVAVLALESELAKHQWNLDQLRDRKANYHLLTVSQLEAYAPGFAWRTFLRARGVGRIREVVLGTDTAVQAQAKVFRRTSVDDWASYLAFHWIQNQIDLLPSSLRNLSFDFYGKRLGGQKSERPREDQAITFVNDRMAEPVGRLYVERYFASDAKETATDLFRYLRAAFASRIATADWMDDQTRREAQTKLSKFKFKIGHPRKWRDFSNVEIRGDDLLGNARRLRQADWDFSRSLLKSTSRQEVWYQSPQTVDASFSVLTNSVELPAAFLQPPFFDPHADPAVNFGSVGAVIGHEMGHGFDDQGAHFDGDGRIRDWWTENSMNHFKARTHALVSQYDAFSPFDGLRLNGKRTLGENIGDLVGVSLAYWAYRLYLRDHPSSDGVKDGFTGDQRFFLSWAQTWRYLAPESAIRYIVEQSYHSPAPYRVNGVVRNIDAWYTSFGVKEGHKLYLPPAQRVKLW